MGSDHGDSLDFGICTIIKGPIGSSQVLELTLVTRGDDYIQSAGTSDGGERQAEMA